MRGPLKEITLLATLSLLLILFLMPHNGGPGRPPLDLDGDEKLYVIVTVPVLADIVANVAGDRALVESLVKPGKNLASYELTPSDSERIYDADLLLYVGYGSEAVLGAYAENIRDRRPVISLLEEALDIDLRAIDAPNPYFWLDPVKVEEVVREVANILSSMDPEGAEEYKLNSQRYIERLRWLDGWIRERVNSLEPSARKLITIRDTMHHFAERYGLEIVGYLTSVSGTYEPQTRAVTELLETVLTERVPIIFIEYEEAATTLREVVEVVAEEAGIDTVEFLYVESLAPSHGITTYIDMMTHNTDLIVSSLGVNGSDYEYTQAYSLGAFDNALLRPFKYEFMRRGALALLMTMLAASLVGSFAVLRGWAIFSDALAHGSIIGLIAAYLLSLDFFIGALAAGLVIALAVSYVERRTRLRTDVIIALTFTTMLALAIATLSYIGGATLSIEDILFADVTAVSLEMMSRTIVLSIFIISFTLLFMRPLLIYSVDPSGAVALGIRTGVIHYGLLLLLALATVSAFMTVGAVPAIASLIIPPASSFLISRRPSDFIVKSLLIAATSAVLGIYISYYVGTNAGAAAVLVAALIFASSMLYNSLRRSK